ncbi:hypothetical protein C2S52_006722 [Perilla frutescens var. hirtella]|nr:hypothetical protein C2S51_008995 [Perilla frutescens var. frutescens]KAH6787170.1 hypothetical protein C2S52_006722 [Perilla frutescens var. hirtella]
MGEDKVIHFTQHKNPTSSASSKFNNFASSVPKAPTICLSCKALGLRNHSCGVIISCLNCFLGKGSLCRFMYGVSTMAFVFKLRGGTCNTAESDSAYAVMKRALYLLENGFGEYDVLTNNCEDFASFCKTGAVCNREPFAGFCQVSSVLGVAAASIFSFSNRRSA